MSYSIVWTTRFKKDYKLAMKRHMDMNLIDDIIRKLSQGETLPEKNHDHELTGDWIGHRECHILLEDRKPTKISLFTRTGFSASISPRWRVFHRKTTTYTTRPLKRRLRAFCGAGFFDNYPA